MYLSAIQRGSRLPGIACARVSMRLYTSEAATINARLKSDLKAAMKAKEKTKLTVIRGVLSDILYAEKNQTGSTSFSRDSDADVAAVIQRAIKQRRDSIQSYTEGGREDLAQEESAELAVLNEYLPEQMSSEQIEARVKQVIERLGVSGIKAMGTVMKEINISPAEAPKSRVAGAVKKLLSQNTS